MTPTRCYTTGVSRRAFTSKQPSKSSHQHQWQVASRAGTGQSAHPVPVPPVTKRQLAGLLAVSLPLLASVPVHAAKPQKVFVAGSTGQTGKQVVKALRAQGISVVAGVRDEAKAKAAGYDQDSGITVRVADVTKPAEELAKAIKGCDAVVCATGGGAVSPFDSRAKLVDNQGTKNLVDAALQADVKSFVLVSSLLTNAKEKGQSNNPNYIVLQLFGGVLEEKLQAEKYLRKSGLTWTVVRPGGLSSDPPETVGNVIVSGEDTFFAADGDPGRSISRQTVGEVCAQALLQNKAQNKVLEIVASPSAPKKPAEQWFDNV